MLNDIQIVAIIAASQDRGLPISDRVKIAVDLLVESVVQAQSIPDRVKARDPKFMEEQEAAQRAARSGLMVPNGPISPELMRRNRRES